MGSAKRECREYGNEDSNNEQSADERTTGPSGGIASFPTANCLPNTTSMVKLLNGPYYQRIFSLETHFTLAGIASCGDGLAPSRLTETAIHSFPSDSYLVTAQAISLRHLRNKDPLPTTKYTCSRTNFKQNTGICRLTPQSYQ